MAVAAGAKLAAWTTRSPSTCASAGGSARAAGVAVAVGGEIAGRDRPLRDGDAVALVLPVAGG
jgi:molybdopterin converting factor small subunit